MWMRRRVYRWLLLSSQRLRLPSVLPPYHHRRQWGGIGLVTTPTTLMVPELWRLAVAAEVARREVGGGWGGEGGVGGQREVGGEERASLMLFYRITSFFLPGHREYIICIAVP